MAQHDYIIDNQPGASFRADLNAALAAIVSNNSGATAPTTPYPFQWWADTTAGVLKQRDASNSEWQDVYPLGRELVSQTGSTGAAILPEGSEAQRPVPGGTGLYVRLNAEAGRPEWYNRLLLAWKNLVDEDQLGVLDAEVQTLDESLGFTIIYPNGGTEASPANVSVNSRYVSPNPFPNHHVLCVAEVLFGGVWGEAGWYWVGTVGANNAGVKASQYGDSIIVQTASSNLISNGAFTGGSFGNISAQSSPLPCRVKVWKLKGAI